MSAKVAEAINAVMGEVGYIQKKGENKFHGYKFAAIGDVLAELQPAMHKSGLIVIQDEVSNELLDGGAIMTARYAFRLLHKSGEEWPSVAHHTGMAAARNSKGTPDDKALNKCHTAARKYFLMALFQIPTGDHVDPDEDGDVPTKGATKPAKQDAPTQAPPTTDNIRIYQDVPVATRMTSAEAKRKVNFDAFLEELYQCQSGAEVSQFIEKYRKAFNTWPISYLSPFEDKILAHEEEIARQVASAARSTLEAG